MDHLIETCSFMKSTIEDSLARGCCNWCCMLLCAQRLTYVDEGCRILYFTTVLDPPETTNAHVAKDDSNHSTSLKLYQLHAGWHGDASALPKHINTSKTPAAAVLPTYGYIPPSVTFLSIATH